MQDHAHELLGHHEVQEILDRYTSATPGVIDDIIPKLIPLGTVVKVMQNLLRENIPIRDTRTILETLAENAARTQDPDALSAAVRIALGRLIMERIAGPDSEIPVITLDMSLEQLLQQSLQSMTEGGGAIEPGLAEKMLQSLKECSERQEVAGEAAILLVPDNLRELMVRMVRQNVSRLKVLAFSEVPENRQLKIVSTVGGDQVQE